MGKFKKRIYLIIEKLLARYTDKIVCISEAEHSSAIKNKITEKEKLNIILNGIDIEAIENASTFSRKELNIPEDAFLIGMVGRISPQKAPDTFIQSARIIKEQIPNAWFMIVGDGEQRAIIEEYARQYQIDLHITGWTDKPYSYLKMFDLAMLLSRWEGFGLAIVEYMAAKKNFIATKIDAIPTIVKDGEDGILVDVDSPEQVAKAVWKLYSDKELSMKLKRNAYLSVCDKYDIRRVAEQHVSMFNDIVKGNK